MHKRERVHFHARVRLITLVHEKLIFFDHKKMTHLQLFASTVSVQERRGARARAKRFPLLNYFRILKTVHLRE